MRPIQAVSARACPICQTELSLSHRQDVEIDYCQTCRGAWLNREELDIIVERNSAESEQQRQSPETRGYREPPLHDDDDDEYRRRNGKPMKSAQCLVLAHRMDFTRPRGRTGMLAQDDKAYYSARAVQEQQRHAEANDPAVAIVHAKLAQRYAELVAEDAELY